MSLPSAEAIIALKKAVRLMAKVLPPPTSISTKTSSPSSVSSPRSSLSACVSIIPVMIRAALFCDFRTLKPLTSFNASSNKDMAALLLTSLLSSLSFCLSCDTKSLKSFAKFPAPTSALAASSASTLAASSAPALSLPASSASTLAASSALTLASA